MRGGGEGQPAAQGSPQRSAVQTGAARKQAYSGEGPRDQPGLLPNVLRFRKLAPKAKESGPLGFPLALQATWLPTLQAKSTLLLPLRAQLSRASPSGASQ